MSHSDAVYTSARKDSDPTTETYVDEMNGKRTLSAIRFDIPRMPTTASAVTNGEEAVVPDERGSREDDKKVETA
jgi:hypothetical protein